MESDFQRHVQADRDSAIAALDEAAELWNAAWEASPTGGRLHLPVLAGIRRGRVLSDVEVVEDATGCTIHLRSQSTDYHVNRPALVLLVMGAVGGLVTVIVPLAPEQLIQFLPLGIVMMIGAWLLVASRLRYDGPKEFLEVVAEIAEENLEVDVPQARRH